MKMEFSEISVKDSPGLCRCCLSEGCYKDMGTEYTWMNETEVYADMLLDCFDVGITQHNDGPNGPKRLICEVCITRLRDACNFKKQVLDSEKKFIDMLGRGEFRSKVLIYQDQLKSEAVEVSLDDMDTAAEVEYLDDIDFQPDDMEPLSTIKRELPCTSSKEAPRKRGRPRKDTTEAPERKIKKTEVKKTKITRGDGNEAKNKSSLTATKRNKLLKENAVIILETSTALPFKWQLQNYLCFYCHLPLPSIDDIKEHTALNHKNNRAKSAVFCLVRDEKVKIEISSLDCKICGLNFENLSDFIDHLKAEHDKKFNSDEYGVIPYKIDTENSVYQCGVCTERFLYFVKLNQHMNKHFGTYVCELCGKSYLSASRLRSHSLQHGFKFNCSKCSESFNSKISRAKHEKQVHNQIKSFDCNYCSQTFVSYKSRKLHHHSAHNLPIQEFSCSLCNKTFYQMSRLKTHTREVHERIANYACLLCGRKFFVRSRYMAHVAKHDGETGNFSCDICKKTYSKKQALVEHVCVREAKDTPTQS